MSSHLGDDHAGHAHDHHDGSSRRTAIAALGPPRVEEVDRGVFAYVQPDGTWWINNSGFVVAPDGVIAIDTCATERRTRAFLDRRRGVAAADPHARQHPPPRRPHPRQLADPPGDDRRPHPCRELVHRVRPSATTRASSSRRTGASSELAPPILTFDDHIDVWAGDTKIELHYIGTPAHTTNDIVAWLPERKVLFAGDLVFNGGTPFVVMGSVAGSLDAVERLRAFEADVIVPGHGPVCGPDGARRHRALPPLRASDLAAEIDVRRHRARSRPLARPISASSPR